LADRQTDKDRDSGRKIKKGQIETERGRQERDI